MDDNTIYIFAEKKETHGTSWITLIGKDIPWGSSSPREAAWNIREYEKKGYRFVHKDVPIEGTIYAPYKYRELNERDIDVLAHYYNERIHNEEYPGLFEEELGRLNQLRRDGINEGVLWVNDVDLMDQDELAMIRHEMGSSWVQTGYFLSSNGDNRLVGRTTLFQYTSLIRYFADALTLRNSTDTEAKEFSSIGRPLNEEDLEYLVSQGLTLAPTS